MHNRGKPLFHTSVKGEDLTKAVRDFWLELNSTDVKKEDTMLVDDDVKLIEKSPFEQSNPERFG